MFEDALNAAMAVIRFLELVAGRGQNIKKLLMKMSDDGPQPWREVFWSMRPRSESTQATLMPMDLPLSGPGNRQQFGSVMASWLDADPARADARFRYSGCIAKSRRYDIDRLVAAANMFDILPPDAQPPKVELSADIKSALADAKAIIKALPHSEERSSLLASLGRTSTNTLKKKVRYRGNMVSSRISLIDPDLKLVLDKAVDCRNHYVHGTPMNFDHTTMIVFMTNALEFTFGSSELLEAGWDIDAWKNNGSSLTHPWGEFIHSFREEIAELKRLLPAGSNQQA